MKMPTLIEPEVLEAIAEIGKLRLPNEACGVLTPTPYRGSRVFEIPNRSNTPRDSFAMKSDDIVLTLDGWLKENHQVARWDQITIWHTHPGGGVGPSRTDLHSRIEHCGNLVVSLYEDSPPIATWF